MSCQYIGITGWCLEQSGDRVVWQHAGNKQTNDENLHLLHCLVCSLAECLPGTQIVAYVGAGEHATLSPRYGGKSNQHKLATGPSRLELSDLTCKQAAAPGQHLHRGIDQGAIIPHIHPASSSQCAQVVVWMFTQVFSWRQASCHNCPRCMFSQPVLY